MSSLPTSSIEFDQNLNRLDSLLQGLGVQPQTRAGDIVGGVFGATNSTNGIEFGVDKSSGETFIQSRNFATGSAGWQIKNDGTAEFVSITASGYIATGGAAADVNAGATIIEGGKITVNGSSTFASGYNPTTKLATTDAGDLAYLDIVQAAKLGTTVIQGGYIITSLLTANNIQAGTLTGRTVQTASSGSRVKIHHDGSISGTIDFLSGNTLWGRLYPYAGGTGNGIVLETHGDYLGEYGLLAYEGVSAGATSLLVAGSSQFRADANGNWSIADFFPDGTRDLGSSTYPWTLAFLGQTRTKLLYPATNNTYDLGTSSIKWKDLYLSGNASVGNSLTVSGTGTFDGRLRLPRKSSAPASPVDGEMYYNTTDDRTYVCQDGSFVAIWTD